MFGIGAPELVIILILALLVLGPERMPRLARDIGRTMGDLRRTSDELKQEFLNADAPTPVQAGPAAPAEPDATPVAVPPGAEPEETAFDREAREARERLAAHTAAELERERRGAGPGG